MNSLEKTLNEKFCNKRFTKKELKEFLEFHFGKSGATSQKIKLYTVKHDIKKFDDAFIFTVNYQNQQYDITMYYLKTNQKMIYPVEFFVEVIE